MRNDVFNLKATNIPFAACKLVPIPHKHYNTLQLAAQVSDPIPHLIVGYV